MIDKRILSLIIIISLTFTLAGCSAQAEKDSTESKYYSDAQALMETLELTHPLFLEEPYPDEYLRAKKAFFNTAEKTSDIYDFKVSVLRYLSSLNDEHTTTMVFGATCVKAPCAAVDDKLFLLDDSGCLTDTEIVEICGVSVKDIFALVDELFPAENESALCINRSTWSVNLDVLRLMGIEFKNYRADITVLEDGEKKLLDVGFHVPTYGNSPEDKASAYGEMRDGCYYFDLNECVYNDVVETEIENLRTAVENGADKVIIDLRSNVGGDSNVCYDILQNALNMTPPNYGALIRFSPLADMDRHCGFSEGYAKNEGSLEGTVQNKNIDLVVLTDENTFSSGTMLTVWVKDGKLGTIIGRPSRNTPCMYGDKLQYTLPLTGTYVSISHKQFFRPDASADPDTVEPDILTDYGEDILKVAEEYLKSK